MAYSTNRNTSPKSASPSPVESVSNQSSGRGKNQKDLKSNIILDKQGNAMLTSERPLRGEIIELQKRHYDQSSTSELLDRGFSEIAKTKDKLTTDNFFNLYQELFYDISKQGKKSHTYLIEESTRYIGGYEDPKDDKIDNLLDRLTEIETAQIETPSEHPLFRNGTAVSNRGLGNDPSPYSQLKKTLGLKDERGKPLPDEDSWTRVTEQTWKSLPKWPAGSNINESADWSLTLSQFNVAVSNITILKENVKSSELDQAEINFLIKELENKKPFLGNTLEDNFNGTVEYEPADLLPFTRQGDSQGDNDVYYKGGEYGDARRLYPLSVMNSIINKFAAKDGKGIYGLGNNIFPKDFGTGIMSTGERKKNILLSGPFSSVAYEAGKQKFRKTRYGNDWKSYLVEELEDLLEEIVGGNFERYTWTFDPERSYNTTTIDGIQLNSGQFYWVTANARSYSIWAAGKVQDAIDDHIAEYSNYKKLSDLEDTRKNLD